MQRFHFFSIIPFSYIICLLFVFHCSVVDLSAICTLHPPFIYIPPIPPCTNRPLYLFTTFIPLRKRTASPQTDTSFLSHLKRFPFPLHSKHTLPHTTMFEQKSQRLMAACAEGNLELVNRIASKFESPEELCEAEPSTGYTPLMMAARHGHLDVVEALVRLGHDSTEISRDPLNNNVLMITAEHGHLAVFELYAHKFPRSVQMSNKQGWSPLTAAARYGVTSMVEMVLNLGADLNHRDEEGSTALHQ
ncbi:unnamed protein product [Mortierella alpina]